MKRNRLMSIVLFTSMVLYYILPLWGSASASSYYGEGTATSPYIIRTVSDFYKIPEKPSAFYILANDLDFQNAKRVPMAEFKGILDGGNHKIKNVEIVGDNAQYNIGLFSKTTNAKIQNITIENPVIIMSNGYYAGVFAGTASSTQFTNCYIENPTITGYYYTGAFCGYSSSSIYNNCHTQNGIINSVWITGGLIGQSATGTFKHCSSTTNIKNTSNYCGGLIGRNYGTVNISESFANSEIRGYEYVGGLVGSTDSRCTIENSYASSSLTSTTASSTTYRAGGIVGKNEGSESLISITNCYSSCKITSGDKTGLAIGKISNSYFEKVGAGISTPASQARPMNDMQRIINYNNWDFYNIWYMEDGKTYPQLRFTFQPKIISVTNIIPSSASAVLEVGETYSLLYYLEPQNVTDRSVTYSSNHSSIAEVDEKGNIKAKLSGTAIITLTAGNGLAAVCEITVKAPVVPTTGIHLSQTFAEMKVDDILNITATIIPENASNKNILWKSSNPNVANVDNSGRITALSTGFAAILALSETDNQIAFCNITVTEKPILVERITIIPETLITEVGNEFELGIKIHPDNASTIIHWESSDPTAVIVDSYGKVSAVASGSAIISASNGDQTIKGTCTITVNDKISSENLALNAKANSNSVSSSTYAAGKANDGDLNTRWLAKSNVQDVYLELDFQKTITFNQIKIKEFGKRIGDFILEWHDGKDWKTFFEGNQVGEDYIVTIDSITSQKIRLTVMNTLTSFGSSIYEFEVYHIKSSK